jgi:hypothetical protein
MRAASTFLFFRPAKFAPSVLSGRHGGPRHVLTGELLSRINNAMSAIDAVDGSSTRHASAMDMGAA